MVSCLVDTLTTSYPLIHALHLLLLKQQMLRTAPARWRWLCLNTFSEESMCMGQSKPASHVLREECWCDLGQAVPWNLAMTWDALHGIPSLLPGLAHEEHVSRCVLVITWKDILKEPPPLSPLIFTHTSSLGMLLWCALLGGGRHVYHIYWHHNVSELGPDFLTLLPTGTFNTKVLLSTSMMKVLTSAMSQSFWSVVRGDHWMLLKACTLPFLPQSFNHVSQSHLPPLLLSQPSGVY